jgi:hypothetical protein
MKKLLFLGFLFIGLNAQSQSLKDLLFSGKMKTDSGTVVRKGDDLKDKVDTAAKKPAPAPVATPAPTASDKAKAAPANSDSVKTATIPAAVQAPVIAEAVKPAEETAPASPQAVATRDNNKIWKEFVDTVLGSIKAEVLSSKKIKKGDYSITIDYTINVDGSVTIGNIFVSPESSAIQEQLKERLGIDTPKLNPMMNTNGVARKVNKRYSAVLSKQ